MRDYNNHFAYQVHKKICSEFFGSVDEYLKVLLFDKYDVYNITKNVFPYKEYEIHDILWINPKYDKLIDINLLNKIIPDKYDYVFLNESNIRSILTIRHYHLTINNQL